MRPRLRTITSSSPAEARAFAGYLGTRRRIRVVGSPQTDTLPEHRPEPGLVLVLTSVTRPDDTGGSAPGTELLLAATEQLAASGRRILVGLHRSFGLNRSGPFSRTPRTVLGALVPGVLDPGAATRILCVVRAREASSLYDLAR
ncbi:hypothetical protein AB0I98_14215 [Streptomyces sp. NPDC050211]|uniref:hypothetical protein n=1 Tax=Streptomyces sp. NPDC050211 TaxID=3154932 RepID=UPI0034383E7F